MRDLDKELMESVERLNKAQDALQPNADKVNHLTQVANKSFYADDESAKAGREVMAIPRRGGAFGVIATAVDMLTEGKAVSGQQLFAHLYDKIQLFPQQGTLEQMKDEFMSAGTDDVAEGTDIKYTAHVEALWKLCESSARAVVLKQMHVNNHMAKAMEDALEKKKQQRVIQGGRRG